MVNATTTSYADISLKLQAGSSLDFNIVDWNDRLSIFHPAETFFGNTSIELLSLGRVVITDRLNASILAYLSRPSIDIFGSNEYRNWLARCR
jgi:exopolysaccharide biosynthesis predicted pyruvyltransferase EpsI